MAFWLFGIRAFYLLLSFVQTMSFFSKTDTKIQASRHRIAALWFGDLDRVTLEDGTPFTGTALMASIYTLAAVYRYYIVFYSLDNRVVETWRSTQDDISISSAIDVERKLFSELRSRNIELTTIPTDTPQYSKALMPLPVEFDEDSATAPAGLFLAPGASDPNGSLLSADERISLRALLLCQ